MRSEFRKKNAFENECVFNAIRRGIRTQFMGEKIAVVFMGLLIVGISSFVIRKCISAPLVDSWIFVLIGGCIIGLIISNITKNYSHCFDKYDNALNFLLKKYKPLDPIAYSELVNQTKNDPNKFIDYLKIWCDVEEKQYNKVRIKEIENDESIKARRYDFTDE